MPRIDRRWLCGPLLLSAALVAHAAVPTALPASVEQAPPVAGAQTPQAAWAAMTPQLKRELRARYAAWQALPEAERQRIAQAAAALAAMPAAQRDALQTHFQAMDQMHRDGWLLGPRLGALYAKLQPLLGYLPAEQREPMLALLHQLDAAQLEQLSLISQRTPPQERVALREQLLALAPTQRAAWLQQNVAR
ncbi:hypothetical protein ABB26_03475 [Stenotrophomonas humi]|uniref:DUF3106 domain-containing protein n=1 Tax=Stenotrophomonas humi TaxID=405444 RepID=A0A0R0CI04_9GAMM|nr:DUF3106 domain-containing protein [Stenotrophomonas humi]KRG65614.1 hypothetical protein ABB26_03475 [Stenotrophomonas humi]